MPMQAAIQLKTIGDSVVRRFTAARYTKMWRRMFSRKHFDAQTGTPVRVPKILTTSFPEILTTCR
jgi:hypothetical protein